MNQTQAMQSLQATLVRITDRFEIDVKIKRHFCTLTVPVQKPDSIRPYHKANSVQIQAKPLLQRTEMYLKSI